MPTHQAARAGLPARQALQVRPRSRGSPTATTSTSGITPGPTGAGASTRSRTRAAAGSRRRSADWAEWMALARVAGRAVHAGRGRPRRVLDVKVDLPAAHDDVDSRGCRGCSCPATGPFELIDYEKVYAVAPERMDQVTSSTSAGFAATACVVVVRPDQYVAAVLPLSATDELAAFFAAVLLPPAGLGHAAQAPAETVHTGRITRCAVRGVHRDRLATRQNGARADRRSEAADARVHPPDDEGVPVTENRETELLARVPDALFIGGEWRAAEGGKTLKVYDPATGAVVKEIADASPADGKAALDAAVEAFPAWAATPRARARRDPPPRVRPAAGAQGGLRAAHDDRDGQAARRGARRGRLRRRVPALVQRGDRAHPGPLRAEPRGHRPHDRVAASGRPVLPHHAVELPARDGDPQDRARARRRLHRRHQAGRAHAADDARTSRSCSRTPACPRAS